MTAPINNNLRNLSQTSVRSRTDSGKNDPARDAQESAENALATNRLGGSSINATTAASQQNVDWFSDLDSGSKLPIVASDRYVGSSIDEVVADIQHYLGFNR